MPWNGSGTYTLPGAYSPEVNGTVIDATRYNGLTNDVASGITAALAKNGENVPTANLPMGGFKHTGAGDGTAAGQYIAFNQATAVGSLTITTFTATTLTATTLTSTTLTGARFIATGSTVPANGMYLPAANTLGLASNTTLRWSVNSTGNHVFPAPSSGTAVTLEMAASGLNAFAITASAGQPAGVIFAGNGTTPASTSFDLFMDSAGVATLRNRSNTAMVFDTNNTNRLTITADGRLYGTALHNNAGAVTGTTNQYIASGTYTPTLTNSINVASSTSGVAQWLRVGNVVTVSCGNISIDPTTASVASQLGISLPIASNFTVDTQCGGTGVGTQSGVSVAGRIYADTVGDKAFLDWTTGADVSAEPWAFHFTYIVV